MEIWLLKLAEVLKRRAKSESSHYVDIQEGIWTPGVKIGARSVAWPESEVEALLAAIVRGATKDELRALVCKLLEARKTPPAHSEAEAQVSAGKVSCRTS